jgi:hypothetical protein
VTKIKYPSYPIVVKGVPSVIKGNGNAITLANIGIKRVALRKKYLREIFDTTVKTVITKNTMISGITVLAATATIMKARREQNFTRGSMP